eukprot:4365499-Amphidinium_carterae.1
MYVEGFRVVRVCICFYTLHVTCEYVYDAKGAETNKPGSRSHGKSPRNPQLLNFHAQVPETCLLVSGMVMKMLLQVESRGKEWWRPAVQVTQVTQQYHPLRACRVWRFSRVHLSGCPSKVLHYIPKSSGRLRFSVLMQNPGQLLGRSASSGHKLLKKSEQFPQKQTTCTLFYLAPSFADLRRVALAGLHAHVLILRA